MKKNIFKTLTCLIAILLIGCEKDLYEDAIHQQHEHQGNIDVKTLSFEEFTQKMKSKNLKTGLEGFMNASQMGSSQAKSGEDTFEIITVDIKQVTSGTYTSYTMFLKTPDPDDKNFYNITFEEKEQDIVLFITKYIATENWITNKNSAFEGEIFTKRIPGNVTEANRLIKLTEAFEGLPDAGNNNPGSGVGSGGGGGTNSGNYPQDCDGEVRTTIIVEPIMCSEYLHWPWSPDECVADVKATFQTTYIYECIPDNPNPISGGTPGSGTGSGSGGGGGSSSGSTAPSLTSIISTLPLECPFPPPGDMDMDCFIDDDEANYLAFINSLSLEQKQYLKNNPSAKDEAFDYLKAKTFSEEDKELAEEIIAAVTDYIEEYGNTSETNEIAIDFVKSIFDDVEDENVEDEDIYLEIAPDCSSFAFINTGPNWQMSAVSNINFLVVLINQNGASVSHVVNYPQPILFGCPRNLAVGNTNITPGMAASLSATALYLSMKQTANKYANKRVSWTIVHLYFEKKLKHNYPNYIPGGRVNINAQNYPVNVIPTPYQSSASGSADCE